MNSRGLNFLVMSRLLFYAEALSTSSRPIVHLTSLNCCDFSRHSKTGSNNTRSLRIRATGKARLFATDADEKLTRLYYALSTIVYQRHLRWRKCEGNALFFSRLKEQSLDPSQGSDRHRHSRRDIAHIQLYDFVTAEIAGVLYLSGYLEFFSRLQSVRTEFQILIVEFCVAQPEAERKQRISREVAIGAALHTVVSKWW